MKKSESMIKSPFTITKSNESIVSPKTKTSKKKIEKLNLGNTTPLQVTSDGEGKTKTTRTKKLVSNDYYYNSGLHKT